MKDIDNKIVLSVLLTVHNRREKTLECLRHLYKNNFKNIELKVFLTDDGSTDGTASAITNEVPDVRIIQGDGNLYWNRGMECAWKCALKVETKIDYFLWLNDDTLLYKDAVNLLLNSALNLSENAIIVGSTQSEEGELSYGGRLNDIKCSIIKPQKKLVKCDTFNGNIVLIPKNVVDQIGIIDHYFIHSFGDIEFGLRAKKNGINSYIAPGILGVCNRNEGIPKYLDSRRSISERLRALYSPLGKNPSEFFYLDRKYRGLRIAVLRYIKLHINSIFPFIVN